MDAGTVAICDVLMQNDCVYMCLSHNAIGDAGAAAIGAALEANTSLRTLELVGNRAGVIAIADAVHRNTTLRSLRLWGNAFVAAGTDAIRGARVGMLAPGPWWMPRPLFVA